MSWLFLLAACTETPTSGHPFEPVPVEAVAPASKVAPVGDDRFASGEEAPFRISSEEMAAKASGGASGSEEAAASGPLAPSDAAIAGGGAPLAAPAAATTPAVAAPALTAVAATAGFPVRLVSTIPQAQPPRAVLGLADGSEVVVSPGSVLGPEGLVVMAVLDGKVQLARVRAAGDHATIDPVEITAQYR